MNNPFETLDKRLCNIENILFDIKHIPKTEPQAEIETPIQLDDVVPITGLSKPTLYGKVQRNEIPHHKQGNRLYFFKSEIVNWIRTGKVKTLKELDADADAYLSNKNKGLK